MIAWTCCLSVGRSKCARWLEGCYCHETMQQDLCVLGKATPVRACLGLRENFCGTHAACWPNSLPGSSSSMFPGVARPHDGKPQPGHRSLACSSRGQVFLVRSASFSNSRCVSIVHEQTYPGDHGFCSFMLSGLSGFQSEASWASAFGRSKLALVWPRVGGKQGALAFCLARRARSSLSVAIIGAFSACFCRGAGKGLDPTCRKIFGGAAPGHPLDVPERIQKSISCCDMC